MQKKSLFDFFDDCLVVFVSMNLYGLIFFFQMIRDGFRGFVDMASRRYLWMNMREMKNDEKVKSS